MRLWAALLLVAAPAWGEVRDFDTCLAAIEADPAPAREAAAQWITLGGGTQARICEAYALEATGARRTAATRLTEIAQDSNAGLSASLRATLFEQAGTLWLDLGQGTLAVKSLAAATRLDAGAARLGALAEAQASVEDWQAVLATIARLPDEARTEAHYRMQAQALLQTGAPDAALTVLAQAPQSPAVAYQRATILAATGARDKALTALADATGPAADPDTRGAAQALLRRLLAQPAAPPPAAASVPTAPRPMPRRP